MPMSEHPDERSIAITQPPSVVEALERVYKQLTECDDAASFLVARLELALDQETKTEPKDTPREIGRCQLATRVLDIDIRLKALHEVLTSACYRVGIGG